MPEEGIDVPHAVLLTQLSKGEGQVYGRVPG